MNISEKVYLSFNIKNCKANEIYQIKVQSNCPSLEMENSFETEKLSCDDEGMDLYFKKTLILNYRFDFKQRIQITVRREVYQGHSNNYILKEDQRNTTLSSLVTSPNSIYERHLKEDENHNILSIELNGSLDNKKNSLFNKFKDGLILSCYFLMDFSEGLNKQNIKVSKNNYLDIIYSIINIISYYTKDKYFIYGFGASLKEQKNSGSIDKNIFNINTNENEKVYSKNINNKINYFPYNNIIPKKKVVFSKILREITNDIFKIHNDKYYNILFMFARELTEDNNIQETKNFLDEMEKLPISIIVICEGQNDFSKMNEFKDYSNKFKFIEYKNINKENKEKIARWSLGEIGKQIIDYYKSVNFENISESINSFAKSVVNYRSLMISESQNNEDEEENEEKIIAKFYNFQKIHEEYKKKKNIENKDNEIGNNDSVINLNNQSNQIYQNNQINPNIQNFQNNSIGHNNQNNPNFQINQNNQNNHNNQNNQNIQNNQNNQNNQINRNFQNFQNNQNFQNIQNNEKHKLRTSDRSIQYYNKYNDNNPYLNGKNMNEEYKYLTPEYNTSVNNTNIINPYNSMPGIIDRANTNYQMNGQNENNAHKKSEDDFHLLK